MSNLILPKTVTQDHAAQICKDTYRFINTKEIITQAERAGWTLLDAKSSKVKKQSKMGYEAHLLTFGNESLPTIAKGTNSESKPLLYVINSHDATRALRGLLGVLRIACLNGIMAGTAFKEFRAAHTGDVTTKVRQGFEFLLDSVPAEIARVNELSQLQLTQDIALDYLNDLARERLATSRYEIVAISVPTPNRIQDVNYDAYTVLNRGQEMLIRGGIKYYAKDEQGKVRAGSTRRIYSIPQSLTLNKLAVERMNELLLEKRIS